MPEGDRFDVLYKDLHWQRGTPVMAGAYLVYDDRTHRVRLAVVTGLAPLTYRAGEDVDSASWPFRAYLGPIEPLQPVQGSPAVRA